jgi:hypothetical protein
VAQKKKKQEEAGEKNARTRRAQQSLTREKVLGERRGKEEGDYDDDDASTMLTGDGRRVSLVGVCKSAPMSCVCPHTKTLTHTHTRHNIQKNKKQKQGDKENNNGRKTKNGRHA